MMWVPLSAQNVTGGMHQPEFTSFEQGTGGVSVNPLTGDLTYILPTIYVPGPAGGYGMPLFYHAGIKNDQLASWVGLGWNMNPGAINRIPVSVPDDWNGEIEHTWISKDLGLLKQNALSISTPWGVGASYDWNNMGGAGMGISVGLGSYLPKIDGAGLFGLSARAGSNGSFVGVSTPVGKVGFANGRFSSPFSRLSGGNLNSNVYATTEKSIVIPLIFINYFSKSIRYWYFYEGDYSSFGNLYAKNGYIGKQGEVNIQDNRESVDMYENPFYSTKPFNHDLESNNLSFPAYDKFLVSGEGIAGTFSAKNWNDVSLAGKALSLGDDDLIEYVNTHSQTDDINKIHFQFDQMILGAPKIEPGDWVIPSNNSNPDPITAITYSPGANNQLTGPNYLASTNQAATPQPINYYTNQEIYDKYTQVNFSPFPQPFMEYETFTNTRVNTSLSNPEGIGGFSITNANGLTYHYALPIYQFEVLNIRNAIDDPNKDFYIKYSPEMFATTWLLTGITGSDFIDRGGSNNGPNGVIDDNDLGYWVKFNYGKWSDGYLWRTPFQGYKMDNVNLDQETFTLGRKQLYYLNSIETASHVAYFIKELRDDGYSSDIGNLAYSYSDIQDGEFRINAAEGLNSDFVPCSDVSQPSDINNNYPFSDGRYDARDKSFNFSVNTPSSIRPLKISQIYVFEKSSVILNGTLGDSLLTSTQGDIGFEHRAKVYQGDLICYDENGNPITVPSPNDYCEYDWDFIGEFCETNTTSFNLYYNSEILDVNDVTSWEYASGVSLESQALQVIDFDQDYELSPGMPNSDPVNSGKLSLKGVTIKGTSGELIMPPYQFTYGLPSENMAYSDTPDPWGYYGPENDYELKPDVDTWSLREITSPLGGKTTINYESDSYHIESALGSNEINVFVGEVRDHTTLNPYVNVSAELLNVAIAEQANITIDISYNFKVNSQDQQGNPTQISIRGDTERTIASIDQVNSRLYLNGGKIVDIGSLEFYSRSTLNADLDVAYGGGLRVASIQTSDGNDVYTVKYDYNNPSTGKTSGVTTYAPKDVDRFIPYINEIPGSNVMYEYVSIQQEGDDGSNEGKVSYHFDVPQPTLDPLDAEFKEIDAVALAYDLPKFSSGQGINLSQRFRSVVSAFNSVRSN